MRIIHREGTSPFDELLRRDGSVTIHHRIVRTLAIEMYKVDNGMAATFMREISAQRYFGNVECVPGNICSEVNFCNLENVLNRQITG